MNNSQKTELLSLTRESQCLGMKAWALRNRARKCKNPRRKRHHAAQAEKLVKQVKQAQELRGKWKADWIAQLLATGRFPNRWQASAVIDPGW